MWQRLLGGGGLILAAVGFWFFVTRPSDIRFGVTFSPRYAEELGLSADDVWRATLDDLAPEHIRYVVYWDQVMETEADWDIGRDRARLEEAAGAGIPVTLAIGYKVPRYPECFAPDWAQALSDEEFVDAYRRYIERVSVELGELAGVEALQRENEVGFPFGHCRKHPLHAWRQAEEQTLHGTVATLSGEQDFWAAKSQLADRIGVSVYRSAWSSFGMPGIFGYPWWVYAVQRMAALPFVDTFVSEAQAEPWLSHAPLAVREEGKGYAPWRMRATVLLPVMAGFNEIDLWGVEWWYREKEHGRPGLWEAGKEIMHGVY